MTESAANPLKISGQGIRVLRIADMFASEGWICISIIDEGAKSMVD
jgi:hypothetical protein